MKSAIMFLIMIWTQPTGELVSTMREVPYRSMKECQLELKKHKDRVLKMLEEHETKNPRVIGSCIPRK